MNKKDMYITWLNNAYAMETDIVKTLEGQLDDFKDYPMTQQGVQKHLDQTKGHAEKVKLYIESNGEQPSAVKSTFASLMGMAKGASMEMMHDKVAKNLLADYATEHLEIMSYKALIETAKLIGDKNSIAVFEEIIADEKSMAEEIERQMPTVIQKFLQSHSD